VIVLYPLALVAAAILVLRLRGAAHGDPKRGVGWTWFLAWAAVGTLTTFSFLTGLSIGLLFLPFAIAGLMWVARRSPWGREWLGFVCGVGAMLLVVAFIQRADEGVDPTPWLAAGLVLVLVLAAVVAYRAQIRRPRGLR
jgi:drug/metabolite transporter (DMT)-like permease